MIVELRNIIRLFVLNIQYYIYTRIYGMNIHKTARISFGAKLDKTNPKGVNIGEESYLAGGVIFFTHDYCRAMHADTILGKRCFVGSNSIIMCGVKIGDEVIIGSGTIVTKDIPSNCIVVGNPGRIIKTGIHTRKFGQLEKLDKNG